MAKRGRPPKMTAEEGLEILEQKQTMTEAGMTRLQKKMSVKQARKFRRLVRERAKQWRTLQERVFTRALREKGGRVSRKAKCIGFDGRSRYVLVDASTGIKVQNGRGSIIPFVYRYPDGNIILDVRLWGVREDEDGTQHLTPTRKGFTVPMAKAYHLIDCLKSVYWRWKLKNPDLVEEPPQPSRKKRRQRPDPWWFLKETGSE